MSEEMSVEVIENAARTAHEVNRAYCVGLGDRSQKPWDDATEWQRESTIEGVKGVIRGNGAGDSHASWLSHKLADGWSYGPVKDEVKKEHPCLVPFHRLPREQQTKDHLFICTVRGVLGL